MNTRDFVILVQAAVMTSNRLTAVHTVMQAMALPNDAFPAVVTAPDILEFVDWCGMSRTNPKPTWLTEYEARAAQSAKDAVDLVHVVVNNDEECDAFWKTLRKRDENPEWDLPTSLWEIVYGGDLAAFASRKDVEQLMEYVKKYPGYDEEHPPFLITGGECDD